MKRTIPTYLLVGFFTTTTVVLLINHRASIAHRAQNAQSNASNDPSQGFDNSRFRESEPTNQIASRGLNTNLAVEQFLAKRTSDRFWDWKQPINFWGIVVDDNADPVSNAKIDFEWNDLSTSGTSHFKTLTDSNGFFELQGKSGKILSVKASKIGYRKCGWDSIAFEYADPTDSAYHIPNPKKRVVFRLIKRGPPEPMIRRERLEFQVPESTGELALDLIGQVDVIPSSNNFDLIIRIDRSAASIVNARKRSDWKVIIASPGGGVQKASECSTVAPEAGYLSELEFAGAANDPTSDTGVREEWLFLRSRRDHHYARIHLDIAPNPRRGGPPVVQIHEYVLNPSGSRNLEFYPEMQVAEKYYVPRDP